MSNTISSLGAQLLEARRQKGWRLADVARRTGRQPARISEVETGKANSTIASLSDIGEALGMSLVFIPDAKLNQVIELLRGSAAPLAALPQDVSSAFQDVFVDDRDPEVEASFNVDP